MSFFGRLASVFRSRNMDQDLEDELRSHLEMRAQDNVASGMSAEEARLEAARRFGNRTLIRERARQTHMLVWLETVLQDVRYAWRTLRKAPLSSTAVILTLAVAIGANTALFSVANTVLFRPLDYPEAERLVILKSAYAHNPGLLADVSFPDYLDWEARSRSFQGMSVFTDFEPNVTGRPEPFRIRGERVGAELLSTLGVAPLMGRLFLPEDESLRRRVIILSHGLWQRLGGDPGIVGKTLELDREPHMIVGVMPAGFTFPIEEERPELWSLFLADSPSITAPLRRNRAIRGSQVLARLKPGVSLARAQDEMAAIAAALGQEYPDDAAFTVQVIPWRDLLVENVRRPIGLLVVAVGLVLLLVCVNMSNLTIARMLARRREIATRLALGATGARILRQLASEALVVAALGGVAGLLVAYGSVPLLRRYGPADIPRLGQTTVDTYVLAFATIITILTGLILGLAPAMQGLKANAFALLQTRTVAQIRQRARSVLIVSEIALATVLLLGAGLLIKSFARVLNVDPGFDPRHLVTMHVSLPGAQYPDAVSQRRFYREALRRIQALPQVESAGSVFPRPLGNNARFRFQMVDSPVDPRLQLAAHYRAASPDYFRTMRIAVLRGRVFGEQDAETSLPVVVINQSMARRFWPEQDPLGRHIAVEDPMHQGQAVPREIVGIVNDVHHFGLERDTEPEMYTPYAQTPWPWLGLVVRSQAPPEELASNVRKEVRAMDPNQPVSDSLAYSDLLAQSVARRRFQTALLGAFAAMALFLAALGIYGVVSFLASQRAHEMGVRMALGAQRWQILALMIRHTGRLTVLGLLLGGALGLLGARMISALLFGVRPGDPLTLITTLVLLGSASLLAAYLPARRATRVDPMIVLRGE